MKLINSDLELAALVLCEDILLGAFPEARMVAPRSGSDNTTTVSWSMRGTSIINPVAKDLLRIHTLHSRICLLEPFVFYHPSQNNPMADDAFCLFILPDTPFLSHMSSTYPQPQTSWRIYPCRRNFFRALSPHCTGSCASRKYSICATSEAVQAVGQILIYRVGQSYSPICISPSRQYSTGVQTHIPARSLL